MKTQFKSINDLKNNVEIGQKIYIENHINPSRNRVTKVKNKLSYFFTVENAEGKESWIINGQTTLKNFGFNFNPEYEKVDIYVNQDNKPFLTLYFNDTIIKGKESINQ